MTDRDDIRLASCGNARGRAARLIGALATVSVVAGVVGSTTQADLTPLTAYVSPARQVITVPESFCVDIHVTDASGAPAVNVELIPSFSNPPLTPIAPKVPELQLRSPTNANGDTRQCYSTGIETAPGEYDLYAYAGPLQQVTSNTVAIIVNGPPRPTSPPYVPPTPQPPFALSTSVTPDRVLVGDTFTVTTALRNTSGGTLAGGSIGIGDIKDMTLVAASSTAGPCSLATISISCSLEPIPNGASMSASATLRTHSVGTFPLNSFLNINGGTPGVSPVVSVTVSRRTADLGLVWAAQIERKTKSPFLASLTLTNDGPDSVVPRVRLTLPAGLRIISSLPHIGCTSFVCQFNMLQSGASTTVSLLLEASKSGHVSLVAGAVGADSTDPRSVNDSATMRLTVHAAPSKPVRRHG